MADPAATGTGRRWLLRARPAAEPSPGDFDLVEAPVPEPGEDEALVRALYLSVDPYMRGRMRDARSYVPPTAIGEVMPGGVVGEVVRSRCPDLAEGDIVEGMLGWQEYAVAPGTRLHRVDPGLAPVSTALGVLGMPGLTAYFGLLDVGRPRPGDTVVVSAASGAVGAVVGQIARIAGCRAVGIVGSDDKAAYIREELGYDAAINRRTTDDLAASVAEACPRGVDVYFDNVGGRVSDAVLTNLARGARIPICGQISQYNLSAPEPGPPVTRHLLVNRAHMEGFLVFDYESRYPEGRERLAAWLADGRLRYREDILDGFENMPRALIRLLRGENFGKQLVRVTPA